MIKLILVLLLSSVSLAVHADYTEYSYDNFLTKGLSIDSGCAAALAKYGGTNYPPSKNGGVCQQIGSDGQVYSAYTRVERVIAGTPPPTCVPGTKSTFSFNFGQGSAITNSFPKNDDKGCAIPVDNLQVLSCHEITGATSGYKVGDKVCNYSGVQSGLPAAAGTAPSQTPAPVGTAPRVESPQSLGSSSGSCPAGTVQGGFDTSGIPICIGSGTAPKAPIVAPTKSVSPTTTTTNADGSTVSKVTTITTNADGSKTDIVETTTTAVDGTVSKTQVGTTGLNSKGAAGSQTDLNDQTDLCKRNPTLSVCRNSNVRGTCGAITCDGDAIQCSTLRAAAAMQCKGVADDAELKASSLHALGLAGVAGVDPLGAAIPTKDNGVIVNVPTSLDASAWLGGGTAFADKSFVIQNHTVTIPFSKWTGYMLALRYALMAVAALVSFKIFSGAVLA